MAPPLGLTFSYGSLRWSIDMTACDAKASLISKRSTGSKAFRQSPIARLDTQRLTIIGRDSDLGENLGNGERGSDSYESGLRSVFGSVDAQG